MTPTLTGAFFFVALVPCRCRKIVWSPLAVGLLVVSIPALGWSQQFNNSDRLFVEAMLRNVAADVRQHYYDPNLHGVDWDARVQDAKKKVDAAHSLDSAMWAIATLLDSLQDSQTLFLPPVRGESHDYGFQMEIIGDRCYVIRVRSGSDAAKKGLKSGDEILAVNENPLARKSFAGIAYILDVLSPQLELRLTLADEANRQRHLDVLTDLQPSKLIWDFMRDTDQRVRDADDAQQLLRARYFEKGDDLVVVKFREFAFSDSAVDAIIRKMRAHNGVVLDLRGNSRGDMKTLYRLLGGMFENDMKIFDRIGRSSTNPVSVSGRSHNAFMGKLVVLTDSRTASVSEIFARVIQLQKRGTVVGDRSSGRVMETRRYMHQDSKNVYSVIVSEADIAMSDGKKLEDAGVEPDVMVLPTTSDLTHGRDPAMAKAAALLGVQLSPEEAAALFPD